MERSQVSQTKQITGQFSGHVKDWQVKDWRVKDGQSWTQMSLEQTISLCQTLAPNLSVSGTTPQSNTPQSKNLSYQPGIMRLETSHHLWNLIFYKGTIALIDEELQLVQALIRKFKTFKLNFQELKQFDQSGSSDRFKLYQLIDQIYIREPNFAQKVLSEILHENLLAIYLETNFDLSWQTKPEIDQFSLPHSPFQLLQQATEQTVQQWKTLLHVRHPFQRVSLLDADDPIASVPLFASATTGAFRINEIADRFRQDISSTAVKLDRLAEKRTVAILPLPTRATKPKERSPQHSSAKVPSSKVFVVDDSPILLKQLGKLVETWGYEVEISSNAATAVDKMLDYKPNIIFLDINMPGTNGFELIKQIRRHPDLANTPLVLITAENNVANNFRAKWASCRFLAKPKSTADTAEFRNQLRLLLRELAPLSTDTLV